MWKCERGHFHWKHGEMFVWKSGSLIAVCSFRRCKLEWIKRCIFVLFLFIASVSINFSLMFCAKSLAFRLGSVNWVREIVTTYLYVTFLTFRAPISVEFQSFSFVVVLVSTSVVLGKWRRGKARLSQKFVHGCKFQVRQPTRVVLQKPARWPDWPPVNWI